MGLTGAGVGGTTTSAGVGLTGEGVGGTVGVYVGTYVGMSVGTYVGMYVGTYVGPMIAVPKLLWMLLAGRPDPPGRNIATANPTVPTRSTAIEMLTIFFLAH